MELKIINLHENKNDKIFGSEDCQALLSMYEDYYPKIGFNVPWVGYFIIRENRIVGSCSFTGQPFNGKVEIAYWTFEEFEGEGIASFACKELLSIAKKANPNLTITAKTAPEHNASTKILEKNGFQFSEVVQDDEIGDAWLWILNEELS
ncbi:MAG: GNAT family N-acetyltransferase [Chitinophagaceae bacterium]|nr:GNAT family N-acetyltransferase [Chitinophagaceae bacterium]